METRQNQTPARVLTLWDDGRFVQNESDLPSLTGIWVADAAGGFELRFGGVSPDYSLQPRVSYQIDGRTLYLTYADDVSCTLECVPAYAVSHYAEPSSLGRVRTITTETYQRTTF